MRLRAALLAFLLPVLALAVPATADAYPATGSLTLFPIESGRSAGYLAAGLDGNLWVGEGTLPGEPGGMYPVGVYDPFGNLVKEIPPRAGAQTLGPDGNFWFAYGPKIGRMTPDGVVTYFRTASNTLQPADLTPGPDGNLWFFDDSANGIYRITPAGEITRIAQIENRVGGIAFGPDGNLWVNEFHPVSLVARVTLDGAVTEFPLPPSDSQPAGIAAGPDGNVWAAEWHRNAIARVTPDGVVTEFRLSRSHAGPRRILVGADGNLWFSESPSYGAPTMTGRITTSGAITEFAVPAGYGSPLGPVAGPDGNLWFTSGTNLARLQVAQRPGFRYVLSQEAGFAPGSVSTLLGNTVQWSFYGPSLHEVADTTGLDTFDSGPKGIASSFRQRFTTAGVYTYGDPLHPGQTGKVTVAPYIPRGVSSTGVVSYTVMWALGPATGSRVFDVQIRRPGTTSYVDWRMGTQAQDGAFFPDAGPGSYSFRVRQRDTATDAKSGYAAKSIAVR